MMIIIGRGMVIVMGRGLLGGMEKFMESGYDDSDGEWG